MPRLSVNQSATSPSFLQSVLAGSVEAELSGLHVAIKDLEKNIQLLTVGVHENIKGRYINLDKFESSDGDYIQSAEKYRQDLEDISSRIFEGQVKTVVEDTAQELRNLQDALNEARSTLLVIHQLLNVDSALQLVKKSSEQRDYGKAAAGYYGIPSMVRELSTSSVYQDLFDALKRECRIQQKHLLFYLGTMWGKVLSWNESGQCLSPKTKLVNLKMFKDQEMDAIDIISALYFVGTLESTLSTFGSALLQLVLVPILTAVTAVAVKDSQEHILLSVEISLSKEKPPLPMVAANLKVVFDFVNEHLNFDMENDGTTLSILGAFISNEFSKVFLNECLVTSSNKGRREEDFSQGLEELNELVEYISDSGFLHDDNVTKHLKKLMKSSVNNPVFWENASYLQRARLIMKKDVNETLFWQENSEGHLLNAEEESKSLEEFDRGSAFAFPSCRVSKWIIELVNLLEEILQLMSAEEHSDRCLQFSKTARCLVEMYAATGPVRSRDVGGPRPMEIALFHNNTLFLAHRLIQRKFDNDVEKHSNGSKLISVDLIQRIRTMAVKALLDCLKQQRNSIVEKTKGIDLANLRNSCAELEKTIKECLLQADHLHSAWNGVLPSKVYAKAMGGLLNSWLEELIKILSSAENIPGNIARDIRIVYKLVADRIPTLLEGPSDIASHVSRLRKFQALIRT